jgi:hypothetical protein
MNRQVLLGLLGAALVACTSAANAADDEFELWLNPSVTAQIGKRTSIEFETAQRFRRSPADDTYYGRLWLNRELSNSADLGVAVEQRFQGSTEETRLHQQLSLKFGAIKSRTRLEQRFVSSNPRTVWRLRQRIGTSVPLGASEDDWSLSANAEGFFTLRAGEAGGQEGLSGLRTFIGFERSFGRVDFSIGYLRQQDIRDNARDRVGHAPLIGVNFNL